MEQTLTVLNGKKAIANEERGKAAVKQKEASDIEANVKAAKSDAEV